MKITIEHTAEVSMTNGLPLRLWRGETADGVPIVALVALLGAARSSDCSALERELVEMTTSSPEVESIIAQVVGVDRFGQCCPPHAGARARLEAAAALCGIDDPDHLLQALFDAGLQVVDPVEPRTLRGEPWLVRDFLNLYRAAAEVVDANLVDVVRRQRALDAEVSRLAPAFRLLDVGPGAQDDPTPRRQRAGALAQAIAEREAPGRRQPLHEAFIVALARDQAIAESRDHRCGRSTPPIPVALAHAILDDERASGPGVDVEGGGTFIAFALRGAALGWHARHAHPGEATAIARAAEPVDEPHRIAFGVGFKLALEHDRAPSWPDPRPRDITGEPVEPVELTSAELAYYWRHLVYRAPELHSRRDRAILAAVKALEDAGRPIPPDPTASGEKIPPSDDETGAAL